MSKSEIIKQLAIKYKVSEKEVQDAVDHQFKFVKEHMQDENLPAIRLPFFGIFKPNKRKLKYIKQHEQRKRKERKDN